MQQKTVKIHKNGTKRKQNTNTATEIKEKYKLSTGTKNS
jgi:hypothetical protein